VTLSNTTDFPNPLQTIGPVCFGNVAAFEPSSGINVSGFRLPAHPVSNVNIAGGNLTANPSSMFSSSSSSWGDVFRRFGFIQEG
jgi:hypothetical protein